MSLVTNSGYETPVASAPVVTQSASTGNLDTNASYNYKVTFVNPWGETAGSALGNATSAASTPALDVVIPVSADTLVSARKIYRTTGGGSTDYGLLTTVNDNTTTSITDGTADGSLGAPGLNIPPATSSALTRQIVYGNIKFNQPIQVAGLAVITAGANAGGQAGATPIGLNQFAAVTTAVATDGVLLPALNANTIGMSIFINNQSANALNVFPNNGQTVTVLGVAGAADAAGVHPASVGKWYVATSATAWVQV